MYRKKLNGINLIKGYEFVRHFKLQKVALNSLKIVNLLNLSKNNPTLL